ncbi:MBL fold metallo-hydrolase (plasmid) [Agrobacterium vitis]|uniref:MBL fold metallo-hydrolase n=1 Tax=Agrobacterium vitis TaxID=373 RepID=UPI0012E884F9|nr:MBL fold metallo-hydrolase [Agrobacterium vitis]MVA25036.1 MBL fold metallo-hydrolase [Agrobacterium vitis]
MCRTHLIGSVSVRKVVEQCGPGFAPEFLYPDWEDGILEAYRSLMIPGSFDETSKLFIASIHTWVVRTGHHTILIDSCAGNNKHRPSLPRFHQLDLPFLQSLSEAGIRPEDVDFVLCTHLHADHTGWNTRLIDGRWVPTFPNAKYVFSKKEYEHWSGPAGREGFNAGVFEDSVLPVIAHDQAMIVNEDAQITDHLTFHHTPGHSVGHVAIRLADRQEEAFFSGDIMHQRLQVVRPEWNSRFCEHGEDARRSRRWLLDRSAENKATIFTAHFSNSSAGKVSRIGDAYDWTFV